MPTRVTTASGGRPQTLPPPRYGRIWHRIHLTGIFPGLARVDMGDIVNLRRARKRAERKAAEQAAAANRLRHGRGKAERDLATARISKDRSDLDRHRIDKGDEG